jgi:hypothetical protein
MMPTAISRADAAPVGMPRGAALLHDPAFNKGTAFSERERNALGPRGLLPPRIFSQEEQVRRVLENFRRNPAPLEPKIAFDRRLSAIAEPPDVLAFVRARMYEPQYASYIES